MMINLPYPRRILIVGCCAVVALVVLGYIAVSRGSAVALTLAALPLLALLLMLSRDAGLLMGLAVTMLVPYWISLGNHHVTSARIAAVLAAFAWLLALRRTRLQVLDLIVFGYFLIVVAGWYLQDDRPGAGGVMVVLMTPLVFYPAARVGSSERIPAILMVVFVAGVAGALSVIAENTAGHVLFSEPTGTFWGGGPQSLFRPRGFYGSPPGAVLVLSMSTICGMPLLRRTRGVARAAVGIGLAVTVTACVLTFTRAGLIGLVVGVALYLCLSRSPLIEPVRVAAFAIALILFFLLALPALSKTSVYQEGIVRAGTFAARVSYWQEAFPIITKNPHNFLFGIGSEATALFSQGGSAPPQLALAPDINTAGTHNQYVLTLLENGALGLGFLVAWLVTAVMFAARAAWRSRDPYSAALAGAVVAFAVSSGADNNLVYVPGVVLLALASGLVTRRRGEILAASGARSPAMEGSLSVPEGDAMAWPAEGERRRRRLAGGGGRDLRGEVLIGDPRVSGPPT